MTKHFSIALRLASLLAIVGCGGRSERNQPPQAVRVTAEELTGAERDMLARADEARVALGTSLKGRLMEALSAGSPAEAVYVCSEVAPAIASSVSQEHQLQIGRTSYKQRNPENQPPAWAQSFVAGRVDEVVYVRQPEGIGVLHPIRMETACLLCHGDPATMSPELVAAIASRYPQDQARGFAEGDLRGWFWVEVKAD